MDEQTKKQVVKLIELGVPGTIIHEITGATASQISAIKEKISKTYDSRIPMGNNPIENLANGIIIQAANDFKDDLFKIDLLKKDIREIKKFFHSGFYEVLTDADPEYILAGVEKQAEQMIQDNSRNDKEKQLIKDLIALTRKKELDPKAPDFNLTIITMIKYIADKCKTENETFEKIERLEKRLNNDI